MRTLSSTLGCTVALLCVVGATHASDAVHGEARLRAEARLREIAEARADARNAKIPVEKRIEKALGLLRRELASPSVDARPHDSAYPMSEIIQLQAVDALSAIGSVTQLAKVANQAEDANLQDLLAIALTQVKAPPGHQLHAKYVRRAIQLVLTGKSDFTRAAAARALREAIPLHPELRSEAIEYLARALLDTETRKDRWGRPVYMVRRDAAGTLINLGVPVMRKDDGTWEVVKETSTNPDGSESPQ